MKMIGITVLGLPGPSAAVLVPVFHTLFRGSIQQCSEGDGIVLLASQHQQRIFFNRIPLNSQHVA